VSATAIADYVQTTHVELADGAQAFYVDTLAPGGWGAVESWAWPRLALGSM